VVTPAARREAVRLAGETYGLSERRGCRVVGAARAMVRYRSRRPCDEPLWDQLVTFAALRRRWGYRRLAILVRRAGLRVNLKRIYRVYRAAGLAVRRRKKKLRTVARPVLPAVQPTARDHWWAMDFLRDALATARGFRVFTLEDLFSREALALEIDFSLPALRVVRVLEAVAATRSYPAYLRVDNGPEFISKALDAWAYQHGVQLVFIDPGKPVQNAHVESFNGKVRDEFLNEHWFASIQEAQILGEAFRVDFNTVRPHSSLKYLTPAEFVESLAVAAQADPPGARTPDDQPAGQGLASPSIEHSFGGEGNPVLTAVAGSPASPVRPQDQDHGLTTAGVT
jgi:putative transposase